MVKSFDAEIFKSEGAKSVIKYIKEKYGCAPEYLWAKFPDNAIFRRADNAKWYAAILTVEKRKLGLNVDPNSDETIEIIDLKGDPAFVDIFVDRVIYFPGYHMNKKHWFTICLDGSVPIDDIFGKIDISYILAGGKANI